jgi:hypothetical protein
MTNITKYQIVSNGVVSYLKRPMIERIGGNRMFVTISFDITTRIR